MAEKPKTIDEYLHVLSEDKRATLESLRQAINSVAPQAEEYFYYQLPAFRLNGKRLVAFGAAMNHCSLYPLSAAVMKAHADDLKKYDTSPGTIRFPVNTPLPTALVRKIVTARMAENAAPAKRRKR
ncbi:MAG: DUF1801 domain-containing protein [Blastocatellia bacterium]